MENFIEKIFNKSVHEDGKKVVEKTVEGTALALTSLILMAVFPIVFGSLRSVKHHKEQKQNQKETGKKPATMTLRDAAIFPIFASVSLFALYAVFHFFSKECVNLLLTVYFFILEVLSLHYFCNSLMTNLVPASVPCVPFCLKFVKGEGDQSEYLINHEFTTYDILCFLISLLISLGYLIKKHWIVNNLLCIASAINGFELFSINNVVTGCILLSGLFFYDVFWVFGTNVMVTVAKSLDAPVKLVFPQDLLEKGLAANEFAMLGLGDVMVPGIFIAFLLRFDNSLNRNSKFYFYTTLAAYCVGLVSAIFVMSVFKHPQPALLYLVPSCLVTPFSLALIKGDIKALLKYEDHPNEVVDDSNNANASSLNSEEEASSNSKKNE